MLTGGEVRGGGGGWGCRYFDGVIRRDAAVNVSREACGGWKLRVGQGWAGERQAGVEGAKD